MDSLRIQKIPFFISTFLVLGGYWVVGVSFVAVCVNFVLFFLGFTEGPSLEYLSQLFLFILIWFIVLCLVAIGIPRFYSEKFDYINI